MKKIKKMKTFDKILVFPDIHGRTFWIDSIERHQDEILNKEIQVIFLGDYLDPYEFERITYKEAFENFEKIVAFAKVHDNVHLLLGNHDMHYYANDYKNNVYLCRFSRHYEKSMREIFDKNKSMFKLAWEAQVGDKKYLFTHAGILKGWANLACGKKVKHFNRTRKPGFAYENELTNTADSINKLLESKNGIIALADVSRERGGHCLWGSPVWADVHEHIECQTYGHKAPADGGGIDPEYLFENNDEIYQVFGHTLAYPGGTMESLDMFTIEDHFAMLDARQAFLIDKDGIKPDTIKEREKEEIEEIPYDE